ncbi:hypothetical protein NXS19_001536 [Fusarium pseudograminearum]|nr:hypothetical protein NXS19_001536 [Fusarium pseudograminearum]
MGGITDPRIKVNPLMPPAKQERIHVWRTEVASALHLPTAPSLSSSVSSSSAATPDLDPDTSFATPPSPAGSRPRSLWKRLSWRFGPKRRTAVNMAAAAAELPLMAARLCTVGLRPGSRGVAIWTRRAAYWRGIVSEEMV